MAPGKELRGAGDDPLWEEEYFSRYVKVERLPCACLAPRTQSTTKTLEHKLFGLPHRPLNDFVLLPEICNLDTSDVRTGQPLAVGAAPGTVGGWAASLVSTHRLPVAPPPWL